jgi:hypothetical protein
MVVDLPKAHDGTGGARLQEPGRKSRKFVGIFARREVA